LRQLRHGIHGAGELSSRQAVAGVPGVGKTTLVQELKAAVLADGYLATDALIPILAKDTAAAVFGRVLGVLYETILVNRPHMVDNAVMQQTHGDRGRASPARRALLAPAPRPGSARHATHGRRRGGCALRAVARRSAWAARGARDGVGPLIGLAGIQGSGNQLARASRFTLAPLTLDELRPMLQRRYTAHLQSVPEQGRVEQLTRWGTQSPERTQTQKSLMKLWGESQGAVSTAIDYLVCQGYVVALPRHGTDPIQYVLSGVSRLIFG
jgi:hypothetical protein